MLFVYGLLEDYQVEICYHGSMIILYARFRDSSSLIIGKYLSLVVLFLPSDARFLNCDLSFLMHTLLKIYSSQIQFIRVFALTEQFAVPVFVIKQL
jgi:hypothetical protein